LTQALFRQEVLQARQVQWLGSIRIGRPPSFAWVTGAALVLALALLAFAVLGEVTRKAKLPGLLVPTAGLLQMAAPQPGQIAEVLVREGELVQAGQALMRLRSERMTGAGEASALNAQALAQRRASLDTERLLIQQQARQRQGALNDRLRSLSSEERQAQGELDTNRLRAQLAIKSQARYLWGNPCAEGRHGAGRRCAAGPAGGMGVGVGAGVGGVRQTRSLRVSESIYPP